MRQASYRHHHHIMPPKGWLNDPNGTCYFNGKYHIFFQYAPESSVGGKKHWGHYTSKDMLHWIFEGIALSPDSKWDRDGAYSGYAYIEDEKMELFYTGNVKEPGDYDYINVGREHNVLFTESQDGTHFSEKELLLTNGDYPSHYSCHVRDPKVWKEGDDYYLLLGGRTRDSKAALLLYRSEDRKNWKFFKEMIPQDSFGYMLECPDYFTLNGKKVLSFCPQGMPAEREKYQNIYQSGYVFLEKNGILETEETLVEELKTENFVEWDMGFDFYAPQTFDTPDHRKILIGWAGLPDAPYGNEPAEAEGWQHSMTLLRELTEKDGKIYQKPIREYKSLRRGEEELLEETALLVLSRHFELELTVKEEQDFGIRLASDLEFYYEDGTCVLAFLNESGCGRTVRRAAVESLKNVHLYMDESILEIYVNEGEVVFTTRYYPSEANIAMIIKGIEKGNLWKVRD